MDDATWEPNRIAKYRPNKKLKYQRERRGWTQQEMVDRLLDLCQEATSFPGISNDTVSRWERGVHTPDHYWQKKLCELFETSRENLGIVEPPHLEQPRISDLSSLSNLQVNRDASYERHHKDDDAPILDEERPSSAYSSNDTLPQNLIEVGNPMDRGEFRGKTIRFTGTALLASNGILFSELAELSQQIMRVVKPPSIEEPTLRSLERRTESLWRDHYDGALPSQELLIDVLSHLKKITHLLEIAILPKIRSRLCSLVSAISILVGTLLFELSSNESARAYYHHAIVSAEEANNATLQAVGWGWMSLAWTYDGDVREALTCIQRGRHLAIRSESITVRAWLAAVEAETQANFGNYDACRYALDEAEHVEECSQTLQDQYMTSFDHLQLAGYKGVCFLQLSRFKNDHKASLLLDAQTTLEGALIQTDSVLFRLKPTFLTDLAGTFVQRGEVQEACNRAFEALMVDPLKSQWMKRRVLVIRHEMERWKDTQYVRSFDEQVRQLLMTK